MSNIDGLEAATSPSDDDLTLLFNGFDDDLELTLNLPDIDLSERNSTATAAILCTDKICDHNPLPEDWPNGLCHFKGSAVRLCGIAVYYDFVWKAKFSHRRRTFTDGQQLAAFVKSNCPATKEAALLLTLRTDVKPGLRVTDTHYIAIVHLDTYLKCKTSPATTYFFSNLTTSLETLQQIENNPEVLRQIVKRHIDDAAIQTWIDEDASRLDTLRTIITANQSPGDASRFAFDELLKRWSVGAIPAPEVTSIVHAVADNSGLACLISALADRVSELCALPKLEKDDGRRMVAAALRASQRADEIKLLRQYIDANEVENKFQDLLDANWWMLGTQYVERVEKRQLTMEEKYDILLRSADGFFDIIELKRAHAELFVEDHGKWIVSSGVNRAVNQTAHYISEIEALRDSINRRLVIDIFKLQGFVIIGYLEDNDPDVAEKRVALRMYNSHLHRIRVLTYDELVRIAEQVVSANTGEIKYASEQVHCD